VGLKTGKILRNLCIVLWEEGGKKDIHTQHIMKRPFRPYRRGRGGFTQPPFFIRNLLM
jgi:hypothetical protein